MGGRSEARVDRTRFHEHRETSPVELFSIILRIYLSLHSHSTALSASTGFLDCRYDRMTHRVMHIPVCGHFDLTSGRLAHLDYACTRQRGSRDVVQRARSQHCSRKNIEHGLYMSNRGRKLLRRLGSSCSTRELGRRTEASLRPSSRCRYADHTCTIYGEAPWGLDLLRTKEKTRRPCQIDACQLEYVLSFSRSSRRLRSHIGTSTALPHPGLVPSFRTNNDKGTTPPIPTKCIPPRTFEGLDLSRLRTAPSHSSRRPCVPRRFMDRHASRAYRHLAVPH